YFLHACLLGFWSFSSRILETFYIITFVAEDANIFLVSLFMVFMVHFNNVISQIRYRVILNSLHLARYQICATVETMLYP
ncbi:hypothetical protein PSZ92_23470, partial [Shigella sonnei]|nr:hypothetical protein [Shigella sonnei]